MMRYFFYMHHLGNGGAARFLLSLLNHLDKNKNQITLIIHADGLRDYLPALDKAVRAHFLPGGKISKMRALIQLARQEAPDVVFTPTYLDNIRFAFANSLSGLRFKHIMREAILPADITQSFR